jgi:hypothetical protein
MKMSEFKVTDVRFLTPAFITVETETGESMTYDLSVDVANRKVYSDGAYVDWGDKVFEYLDAACYLPEDFFTASEDIYEKASEAFEEARKNREQHTSEE